ncbi:MAG: hypothetical protein ACOY0T_17160 [Myxococcota bacterium]
MKTSEGKKQAPESVAQIIASAGGKVVGRTRLQKLAYLLELSGLGEGFQFSYRHYGPFSEGLATAARDAMLLGLIVEEEQPASWGGSYSIYTTSLVPERPDWSGLARVASGADPVELELAATAAFLALEEQVADPWQETARRKPEKAEGERLSRARELYRKLSELETPRRLPNI